MYTKRNKIRDLVELVCFKYRYKRNKNNAEEMEVLNHQVSLKRSMLANKQQLQNMLGEDDDDSEETSLSRVIKRYYEFSKSTGIGDIGYIGDTAYFAPAR